MISYLTYPKYLLIVQTFLPASLLRTRTLTISSQFTLPLTSRGLAFLTL